MKVYIVECGCYDSMYIGGVYASPEAAMAAHPVPENYKFPETPSAANLSRRGGWRTTEHGWDNGLDWSYSRTITEFEVEGLSGDGVIVLRNAQDCVVQDNRVVNQPTPQFASSPPVPPRVP
jgi:hypothetical protein